MIRFLSLWKKPVIYKTIVQMYLVFSIIFVPFSAYLTIENYVQHSEENPNSRNSLAGLFIGPVIWGALISTTLSVVSFTLLIFNRESGYYSSAVTLFVLFFIVGISISSFLETISDFYLVEINEEINTTVGYASMSITVLIAIFLLIAWTKWREIGNTLGS